MNWWRWVCDGEGEVMREIWNEHCAGLSSVCMCISKSSCRGPGSRLSGAHLSMGSRKGSNYTHTQIRTNTHPHFLVNFFLHFSMCLSLSSIHKWHACCGEQRHQNRRYYGTTVERERELSKAMTSRWNLCEQHLPHTCDEISSPVTVKEVAFTLYLAAEGRMCENGWSVFAFLLRFIFPSYLWTEFLYMCGCEFLLFWVL